MSAEPGITDPSIQPPEPLIQGFHILCPNCKKLRLPEKDLSRLKRDEAYRMDLAPIYRCKPSRGGCGHVFAPCDMRIIQMWLSGDIIPRSWLDDKIRQVNELEAELSALRERLGETTEEETEVTSP